jgi:hypothetical protein
MTPLKLKIYLPQAGVYNSEYDHDSAMSSVRWNVLYDELYTAQTDTTWHLPTPDSVLSRGIAHYPGMPQF